MKRCILISILLWAALHAQIQVLPDIEVSGESQIKIFLYKKALPYSSESIARDSIMAFIPASLPLMDLPFSEMLKPRFQHYLNLQGDTSWGLMADYRYYPDSDWLSDAKAMLSMRYPARKMHSHHLLGSLDFALDEGEAMGFNLKHFDSEMKGLDSKYTLASLTSYHDRLALMDLNIRQMSNEIRIHRLEQDRAGVSSKNNGLGFTHQSLLDFANFTWGNRLYLYTPKPVLHSYVELHQDKIDKFSIHALHDGYRFFAVPGFHFRYITDYDQQLSIVSEPETQRGDFGELLEEYRWLSFASTRRNTTIPLNLKIALEDTHATDKSYFLHRYLLANTTKYKVNAPILRDSPNPAVPELHYSDVFSNESGVYASFGQGIVVFEQAIVLYLSYMPGKNWVREPYAPLLKVESALVYQRLPFEAGVSFNQHFFAKDHYQNPLPELLDLCINAAYDLSSLSQLYLKAENLLNSPKWQFKSLPRQDVCLYAGFVHRF
ncbi:MAG: hypothetical protein WC944_03860 [Candidatus Cloacimonadaceae bacterium]